MRHEQIRLGLVRETAEFKFHFQLCRMGARHACSVAIHASDRDAAVAYFRQHWATIEKLAREGLADSTAIQQPLRLEAHDRSTDIAVRLE